MSAAIQKLEHSRDRIRRHLIRSSVADHQQQRRSRMRRRKWVGVAVVAGLVTGLLIWHKPWRKAPGLAGVTAFLIACMQAPGMLTTLAARVDSLATWWRALTPDQSTDETDGGTNGQSTAADTRAHRAQPPTSAP